MRHVSDECVTKGSERNEVNVGKFSYQEQAIGFLKFLFLLRNKHIFMA